MRIVTPMRDAIANHTSNALFCPLTGPMNTNELDYVGWGIYIAAATLIGCEVAVQFSDDGVTWPTTITTTTHGFNSGGSTTAAGWTFGSSATSMFGSMSADVKLYCRFGVKTLTSSGLLVENCKVQIALDLLDQVNPRTFVFGPYRCASASGSPLFIDFSGPISTEDISNLRYTVEVLTNTGTTLLAAYQVANEPLYASNWQATTTIGSNVSALGITAGTTYTAASFSGYKFVRFGLQVTSTAGIEAAIASLRVDVR